MILTNGTTYYNDIITNAIQYAQTVEQAAFKMLNLSIQELLDCDTSADQGCTVSQAGNRECNRQYLIERNFLNKYILFDYLMFILETQKYSIIFTDQ
jgi:hypothetical protein